MKIFTVYPIDYMDDYCYTHSIVNITPFDLAYYARCAKGQSFTIQYRLAKSKDPNIDFCYTRKKLFSKKFDKYLNSSSNARFNKIVSNWQQQYHISIECPSTENLVNIKIDEFENEKINSHFQNEVTVKGKNFCDHILKNRLSLISYFLSKIGWIKSDQVSGSLFVVTQDHIEFFPSIHTFNKFYQRKEEDMFRKYGNNDVAHGKVYSTIQYGSMGYKNLKPLSTIDEIYGLGLAVAKEIEKIGINEESEFISSYQGGKLFVMLYPFGLYKYYNEERKEPELEDW